jgi:hypothetical protein
MEEQDGHGGAVDRIELDSSEIDGLMCLIRKGLVEAAARHDGAEQDLLNFTAELSMRLSRLVNNEEHDVVENDATQVIRGQLNARKVFRDDPGGAHRD